MTSLRAGLVAALLLVFAAAPAQAGTNSWTGLPGLDAANGANWIREYAYDAPTTIYAATEGDGVYRSTTNGVSWSAFNSGLDAPGAKTVRTVYLSGGSVYAGTDVGLFKSTGGGAWQPIAQGPEDNPAQPKKLNRSVQTVLKSPTGSILAGTFAGGVYKSGDDGATWTPPAPGNGMPAGETVWSLAQLAPPVVLAATSSGIYRSIDFGSTWTLANDGISGTTLRVFADGTNPNIYYAATPGNGVFRSLNLGLTWSAINGSGSKQLGNTTVRALQQFNGVDLTRLYAGTADGVWAAETKNGPLGGPVTWRKVTNNGLITMQSTNTIFWALTNFVTTPGTLIGGTQSNGGYALTLTPPTNSVNPSISAPDGLVVGKTVTSNPGTWNGTQTIEFEYQWQRCTTSQASSCADIADETAKDYVIKLADQGNRLRVVVTAKNDFPTFSLAKDESAVSAQIAANPGTLPGANQLSAPSINGPALPQSGDTVTAQNWLFNPAATSTKFQWSRCDANGANCDPIAGATSQTITLTDLDVTRRLRVVAIGTNSSGSAQTPISGATNTIFPEDPTQLAPTTLVGSPYVGESLIGGVGMWRFPGTNYKRQWENCNADGQSCSTISGETGPSYTVRSDDLGDTIRARITVDSNGPNTFPGPVEVFTPTSAVITNPPPPPAPGDGDPGPGGGGQPNAPVSDVTAPVLSALKFSSARVKQGGKLKLGFNLSEPSTLSIRIDRLTNGRKKGKKCVRKGGKGKKCTIAKKVGTISLKNLNGKGTVSFKAQIGKKKLAVGNYQAVVTPVDGAGNKGAAKKLKFKVTRR